MKKPKDFDDYISLFPEATREKLLQMRSIILKAAPEAEERISYGMPAFNLYNSYLVYFGGFKNHIGMYPAPIVVQDFKKDLDNYKTGKGSVQFPLNEPLPAPLITKIINFQIKQNAEKMKAKSARNQIKK